jgi:hypothetical protein
MRAPFWRVSLLICVLAAFGECASARQQSEDLAASPTHNEAPAAWKEAPASHDSPNGAPVTRETTSRAPTARKEARGWREIPKGTPVAHENRKGTPAAHESQQSASAVRENQKNESPGARERRALRDKLNAGLVAMIGFVLVAMACIVVLPVALNYLPGFMGFILNIVRWPVMLVLVAVALAVIYRYGPSRDEPKWRWITWGSTLAALAWLGFSAIFSFYAAHFGSFNKTYGSLGAVIGFMTWMWLSVAVILLARS